MLKYLFVVDCMEIENHLKMLGVDETNKLLNFNRDFIKNLRLFEQGGNFSQEEVAWYDDMLKEVDEKVKQEMEGRSKRLEEIKELLSRKKQQLNTQFESEYAVALEDLSAKTGTGKKYGKPRRMAQVNHNNKKKLMMNRRDSEQR